MSVFKVANIRLQIEREIARLSICDLPPPYAAPLVCFAAIQYFWLWVFIYGPNMQLVSRRAAGVAATSQRWIKSCVKLPL